MNINNIFKTIKKEEEHMNLREKKLREVHVSTPNIILSNKSTINISDFITTDLDSFDKSSDKMYINVYQSSYKNGASSTGLGDFIRGTYFMMQFCDINECKYDTIVNHPISRYMKNALIDNTLTYEDIPQDGYKTIYENIVKFEQSNFKSNIHSNNIISAKNEPLFAMLLKKYLKRNVVVVGSKIFVYMIAYPMLHTSIKQEHRLYIQRMMEGTDIIMNMVSYILKALQLEKGEYTLIHVRCGDNFLIPNYTNRAGISWTSPRVTFNKIKREIGLMCSSNSLSSKYFLMADNNHIKKEIVTAYPFIKTWYHELSHIGEGVKSSDVSLKNVMVDYHIIASSKRVVSYSVYTHGSGFSKWCAETYNIPHVCKYVG